MPVSDFCHNFCLFSISTEEPTQDWCSKQYSRRYGSFYHVEIEICDFYKYATCLFCVSVKGLKHSYSRRNKARQP